jgi:hypothetical protein
MSGASVAITPEALPDIKVAGSGATETRTSANRPLPRTGLVATLPPLSRGWRALASGRMSAPTWRLFLRPAFDVETEASCGISVAEAREALTFWRRRLARLPWYRAAARAEAREMVARWRRRVVQAELERWRLRGLARFLLPVIDRCGPRGGIPARRVARFMLFAVRATRVGRLLAVVVAAAALSAAAAAAVAFVAVLL